MTHEDIPLPPAVRRRVKVCLDTVERGFDGFLRRFGTPEFALRSNYTAVTDLTYALTQLRRLHKIVLYVLVIFATRLAHMLPFAAETQPRASAWRASARRAERAGDSTTWRLHLDMLPRPRVTTVGRHARPAQLAKAPRSAVRLLARKMEALRRLLAAPMPYATRLARRLYREGIYICWRPPKHKPVVARRDFLEELEWIWEQADFDLKRWRPVMLC